MVNVKARAIVELLRLTPEDRFAAISQGLELLTEHVMTLTADLRALVEADRCRGARAIEIQAREETSKILILLDFVRMPVSADEEAQQNQLRRFYDHLARGIYAYVTDTNPADFREIRELVEGARRSHFLDGPNDVDWIYRNEIRTEREDSLYVDYVIDGNGARWISPAERDTYSRPRPSRTLATVGALRRSGALTSRGLGVVAKAWRDFTVTDKTHWQEVASLNGQILEQLVTSGLTASDFSRGEKSAFTEHWGFPLSSIPLTQISVPMEELQRQRDRYLDREYGDGDLDGAYF